MKSEGIVRLGRRDGRAWPPARPLHDCDATRNKHPITIGQDDNYPSLPTYTTSLYTRYSMQKWLQRRASPAFARLTRKTEICRSRLVQTKPLLHGKHHIKGMYSLRSIFKNKVVNIFLLSLRLMLQFIYRTRLDYFDCEILDEFYTRNFKRILFA